MLNFNKNELLAVVVGIFAKQNNVDEGLYEVTCVNDVVALSKWESKDVLRPSDEDLNKAYLAYENEVLPKRRLEEIDRMISNKLPRMFEDFSKGLPIHESIQNLIDEKVDIRRKL